MPDRSLLRAFRFRVGLTRSAQAVAGGGAATPAAASGGFSLGAEASAGFSGGGSVMRWRKDGSSDEL